MHRAPLDIGQSRATVDGIAEDVEHTREDSLPYRRLERAPRILHLHAASETLCRRQGNTADTMGIAMYQHLYNDAPFAAGSQHRVDRRQVLVEPHIHDAAAHRDHHTGIRWICFVFHFYQEKTRVGASDVPDLFQHVCARRDRRIRPGRRAVGSVRFTSC